MLGGLFALMAVMAGAFGAHSLRDMVSARGLEIFQTGATYQMYHALGLVLVAVLSGFSLSRRLLSLAAGFFTAGILIFSGSLYLLVLTQSPGLGAITPVGGVCFMVGWVLVVIAGLGSAESPEE
jgi:uncharacterized membrane protein YgdD (TMEM256/DUF423 family)